MKGAEASVVPGLGHAMPQPHDSHAIVSGVMDTGDGTKVPFESA
jgi:hypothetical protein